MAKDPAFLFYSSDFLTGTALMKYDQIGKYVKLLCYQHQFGRLTKDEMLEVCGFEDQKIFSKFSVDENGNYYNERLEKEIHKRKKFVESRQQNLNSRKSETNDMKSHMDKHMDAHMGTHMEEHT